MKYPIYILDFVLLQTTKYRALKKKNTVSTSTSDEEVLNCDVINHSLIFKIVVFKILYFQKKHLFASYLKKINFLHF
jgi:hypothetical protein